MAIAKLFELHASGTTSQLEIQQLLIDHSSKNSLLQTAQALISSTVKISNSIKIEKRILFDKKSFQKFFITKQLREQFNSKCDGVVLEIYLNQKFQ